jgi:hypothetical protein
VSDNSLFRLAKKVKRGRLFPAEKRALIAIADTCSMSGGVCRKSAATIENEYDVTPRNFHYALKGRKRKNGTSYFPGLLARKIVEIVSGGTTRDGVPTEYRINENTLQSFVEETSAQEDSEPLHKEDSEPLHKEDGTSAQMGSNLCTIEGEPLHICAKPLHGVQTSSNTVQKRVLKESSNYNSAGKDIKKIAKEISALAYTLCGRLAPEPNVRKALKSHSQDNLESAFKTYVEGLSEDELKWAVKNFWIEGGYEAVIFAREQKEVAAAKIADETARSIEAGQATQAAWLRKLEAKAEAEEQGIIWEEADGEQS